MKVIFYLYSRSALHSMVYDVMLCLSVTSHTGTVLRQLNLWWWHATEGGGTVLVETLNPAQSVNRYWGYRDVAEIEWGSQVSRQWDRALWLAVVV